MVGWMDGWMVVYMSIFIAIFISNSSFWISYVTKTYVFACVNLFNKYFAVYFRRYWVFMPFLPVVPGLGAQLTISFAVGSAKM